MVKRWWHALYLPVVVEMVRCFFALIPAATVWAAAIGAIAQAETAAVPANFDSFLQELWPDAQARGISRTTFDLAFAGLTPDARVIAATQKQPEYGKPVGAYVNSIASTARIATGKQRASQWAETLTAVEARFAVERWVILGIWGIETSFGDYRDGWDAFAPLPPWAQAGS